jgi:hypothetical protein
VLRLRLPFGVNPRCAHSVMVRVSHLAIADNYVFIRKAAGAACPQGRVKHLHIITPLKRHLLPLAITTHYSQRPNGRVPIEAGIRLAYNGKMIVYRA